MARESSVADAGLAVLVEDDQNLCALIENVLADRGYRVEACGDGVEAWPLIHMLRPDLVILDLQLPGIGGLELLVRLRSDPRTASTAVLVCSGARDELRALAQPLQRLHCEVLEKPFDLEQLEQSLGRLIPGPASS